VTDGAPWIVNHPDTRYASAVSDAAFWVLILDLLILLGAAAILGVVCERLRQSAVVGYMLAGVIVGPNGTGLIPDTEQNVVNIIAQLGVALLMFSIGLEFSWSKLKRLGATALGSGVAQIVGTMALAGAVATLFDLSFGASVAVGAIVALSSTAVVAPVLAKRGEIDSPHGRFDLGILLVQDAAVVPLVLLVTALGGEGTVGQVLMGAGQSVLIVGGFVLVAFFGAKYMLPWILRGATSTGNREIVILFAFAAAAGASVAANALGISPALGAFIVAIFLGESPLATQVRADVAPLKTLFVTMFFGSIGMLANPAFVMDNWWLVLVVVTMVAVGKPLVVTPIALVFRLPLRHAIAAGLCMGQIGVFSFVLLQAAQAGDVIGPDLGNILITAIILSILITPYLVALGPAVGSFTELRLRRLGLLRSAKPQDIADPPRHDQGHVALIGFGPAGRAVADALREEDATLALADLNMRTVLAARSAGMRAVVGDATQRETLELLDLASADALVITLPDHRLTIQVIRQARAIAPGLRIIARSRYSAYVGDLERAGAAVVIDEETTLGNRVGEALRDVLKPDDDTEDKDVART